MGETVETYAIGILGFAFLIVLWVTVQTMWRKFFRDYISDPDVLAGRRSCGNCGCTTACIRKETKEKIIS